MRFRLKKEEFERLDKEELMAGIISSVAMGIGDALVRQMADTVNTVLRDHMAELLADLVTDFNEDKYKSRFDNAVEARIRQEVHREIGIILLSESEE